MVAIPRSGNTPREIGGDERPTSQKQYPNYDQNLRFSLHYPTTDHKFETLFLTWLNWSKPCIRPSLKLVPQSRPISNWTRSPNGLTRHLHQRIEEHRATAVGAHVKGCHGISNPELLKQFFVLKEMPGKAWLPHQRNAFHPYEETEVEHTIELNSRESICLEHFNARALICWLTI